MGLVSRVLEEEGVVTVNVSTGRDITARVRPPRSVFVNHPMGNPFGRPGEGALQREILLKALEVAATCEAPGTIVDLPLDWGEKVLTIYDLESGFKISSPDRETGKQQN